MATSDPSEPLARYWAKRDFSVTPEPRGARRKACKALSFVIQKHAATRLHYDFRLALDGVFLSWAVPKGPSYDPSDKRMAIRVEDHPLSYGSFEGTIPPGQYGAGTVIVWDHGTWEPVGDPHEGLAKGKLVFHLNGQKMAGLWELVRIAKGGEKQVPWILFKKRDGFARPRAEFDVTAAHPDSVIARPLQPARRGSKPVPPPSSVAEGRGGILPGAVKAPLPDRLAPQLATLATGIPSTGQWTYELKFDGYRLLTRFEQGRPTLITRGGHDWSAKMPALLDELARLGMQSGWLDGEIVVLGQDGTPDFHALQTAFDGRSGTDEVVYFLFDVPFFEGHDLRRAALADRRKLLKAWLQKKGTEHVRFSESFDSDPTSMLRSACRMGMEGVIAKRLDAPYTSTRNDTWLKLKCRQRQEFVVCGYADRTDGSPRIGSLMLGVHDERGQLVSVGSVGTGWRADEAEALKKRLARLEVRDPPFADRGAKTHRWSRRRPGSERWVQPTLVAEVEFAAWTPDKQIRHAVYIALRADKPARSVVQEAAKDPGAVTLQTAPPSRVGSMQVSHGERVIDPSTGLTKLDLVRYYESVAEWMLPHLRGRPCSLVRGPHGIEGTLFFQKHGGKTGVPHITELAASLWPGHAPLLSVDDASALVGAAQFNVIEFHTWNAAAKKIGAPDRMVFDLDPGEGTKWPEIQEAALLVKTLLEAVGLRSWLKTSGGKGLHVVVPLKPRHDFDTVKAFSQAIVQHLAQTIPSRFVAKPGASHRVGRIFVDYLRNGHGATTVAAFSARARPGLGVSMPVDWADLMQLRSGAHWTITTARDHLSFQTQDPWRDHGSAKQELAGAMKALGFARPTPRRSA